MEEEWFEPFDNFDELSKKVDSSGGVVTTTMGNLRDAAGYGKLGVHVVKQISQTLAGKGLGHYPDSLVADQRELIRVYRLGSQIAELIEAVLDPSEANDQVLRDRAGGEDARILGAVRRLVCT